MLLRRYGVDCLAYLIGVGWVSFCGVAIIVAGAWSLRVYSRSAKKCSCVDMASPVVFMVIVAPNFFARIRTRARQKKRQQMPFLSPLLHFVVFYGQFCRSSFSVVFFGRLFSVVFFGRLFSVVFFGRLFRSSFFGRLFSVVFSFLWSALRTQTCSS